MSESLCGDRVCSNLGCTDDCGLPAGSSVPEAARAAERFADDEVRNGPKNGEECPRCTGEYAQPCAYHEGYDDGASTIRANIPTLVAAASVELQQEVDRLSAECEALRGTVAEERATTEWQPGRWWTVLDKDGGIWCQTSDEKEARRSMRDPERAPYTLHRQWVTVQRSELRPVRAALASPGEES